jgi:hypothetical protein
MIRKIFYLSVLAISAITSAQQFGIEANYGMNATYDPKSTGFNHFGAGVTYDFDDAFGVKLDFASDKFEIENILRNNEITGTNNTRISIQATANISSLLNGRAFYEKFNLIAHTGTGISILKSEIPENTKTDHILNFVVGITPRYEIARNVHLFLDVSALANVSQHYTFDGEVAYVGAPNSFTGLYFNSSIGISYRFGRQ